jgi:hypothetical protein
VEADRAISLDLAFLLEEEEVGEIVTRQVNVRDVLASGRSE